MSAKAFGSDCALLEGQMSRFRDPLNKERRFIPVRLDDAPVKGPGRNSFTSRGPRRTKSGRM